MWLDDFSKNIHTITSEFTTGLSLRVYKLKISFPLKKMNEVFSSGTSLLSNEKHRQDRMIHSFD